MQDVFLKTGELLVPAENVDPSKWACVACDQYTSQPQYWQTVEAFAGDAPSAEKLILPECWLHQAQQRIPQIHQNMRNVLADGTLTPGVVDGMVLTERSTGSGARIGLVTTVDLEAYDYRAGSHSPVRATEGTIVERIPPRLAVRRGAVLELSHVLMLIDDPMMSVVEPVYERRFDLPKLYDFPLMMDGGHLTGYAVTDPADLTAIFDALRALYQRAPEGLLYAVGDGNHSLATAKAYWDELKPTLTPEQQLSHPARFAMIELENIHDDALVFEPIHRVLYGYDGDDLLAEIEQYAMRIGCSLAGGPDEQDIDIVYEGKQVRVSVTGSPYPLAVGTLQAFLDDWLAHHPQCRVDYIHGEAAVRDLVKGEGAIGFLLPALDKSLLFPAVVKLGALPRKTFSMGEAHEKRYYMEARRLG